MNDELNFNGTVDYDKFVPVVPDYLLDMESESSNLPENSEEELGEDVSSESELESESESESESSGENNTVIDYTEILEDVQSTLENIETNQLFIIDNLEALETKIDMIENVSFYTFYLLVALFIGCVFLVIYNWINNFIK